MATLIPPLSKKKKKLAQAPKEIELIPNDLPNVLVQFQASDTGENTGECVRIPGAATVKQLEMLLNELLKIEDPMPYNFSVIKDNGEQKTLLDITDNVWSSILKPGHKSTEDQLTIVYTPRAVFKVKIITRSTASIPGHKSTILTTQFAPYSSSRMASGSGDFTARIWDCDTQTPLHILKGHTNWVLCVSWSPCGKYLATGSMDNTLRIWDPRTGQAISQALTGHNKWITSLSWQPLHLVNQGQVGRLASSSKDGTIRIWNVGTGTFELTLSGHKSAVTFVKWGGLGFLYSASHDKTVKVWNPKTGQLIHNLLAHAHWVNHIALSTDYALRLGGFDHDSKLKDIKIDENELRIKAKKKFEKLFSISGRISERIVTASDDFNLLLWEPEKSNKPLCRMSGHQKAVNHVTFSPDGRYIASASFDNSIKLWDGRDGKFLSSLRGHVAPVYQCAWSSDCRLLVSCSKDTTLKIWDVRTFKLLCDLPGHSDEIFAVDWSVDGSRIASGGKDKMIRLWSH